LQALVDADTGRILGRGEIQSGRGAADRVVQCVGVRLGVGKGPDLGDKIDRIVGRSGQQLEPVLDRIRRKPNGIGGMDTLEYAGRRRLAIGCSRV
jgi:hypothetical protein